MAEGGENIGMSDFGVEYEYDEDLTGADPYYTETSFSTLPPTEGATPPVDRLTHNRIDLRASYVDSYIKKFISSGESPRYTFKECQG